jgi:hypothetical protein
MDRSMMKSYLDVEVGVPSASLSEKGLPPHQLLLSLPVPDSQPPRTARTTRNKRTSSSSRSTAPTLISRAGQYAAITPPPLRPHPIHLRTGMAGPTRNTLAISPRRPRLYPQTHRWPSNPGQGQQQPGSEALPPPERVQVPQHMRLHRWEWGI